MVARTGRALRSSALPRHLLILWALARGVLVNAGLTGSGLWRTVAFAVDRLFFGLERGWRERAEFTPPDVPGAIRWAFRVAPRLHAFASQGAGAARRVTAAHLRLATRADQRLLRAAP